MHCLWFVLVVFLLASSAQHTSKPSRRPTLLPTTTRFPTTQRPTKRPIKVTDSPTTTRFPTTNSPTTTRFPTTPRPTTKDNETTTVVISPKPTFLSPSASAGYDPLQPSSVPSSSSTSSPTSSPTASPSSAPTTNSPTTSPTLSPVYEKQATASPTVSPSSRPTVSPSKSPSRSPSKRTSKPTTLPTASPSILPTSTPTSPHPPNVLLILADDFKPLIKSFGSPKVITPNLDRLAKDSVSFLNAHAQMSICGPSRASFLTSLRPDETGIVSNTGNTLFKKWTKSKSSKEYLILPKLFKINGYDTFGVGKIFHEAETSFCSATDVWTEPMYTWISGVVRPPQITSPYQGTWISAPNVTDDFFPDGQAARIASSLITDKLAKSTTPWFLAVGFWKPHLPWFAPKKFFDLAGSYENYSASHHDALIDGLTTFQYNKVKGNGCGEASLYQGAPSVLGKGKATIKDMQLATHAYHATAMFMDEQVGRVLNALDASEARNNTIVVFMGDHGFHLGDKGLYCKHTNFDQGTRTPLIIRPVLGDLQFANRGTKSYAPVELLDLMPTLHDMAGLRAVDLVRYRGWQGMSLVPILKDPANGSVKQAAVSQYFRGKGTVKIWGYSIRTTSYRYTNWDNGLFSEFYDYVGDEYETKILRTVNVRQALQTAYATKYSRAGLAPFDFARRTEMQNKLTPVFP